MFADVSQVPPFTSLHRAVKVGEAHSAVTLNGSMKSPVPCRAHYLAVSCFDMGPNTASHTWLKVLGLQCRSLRAKLPLLAALSLQRQERCFSGRDDCGMWGSRRAGWLSAAAAHLFLLEDCLLSDSLVIFLLQQMVLSWSYYSQLKYISFQ